MKNDLYKLIKNSKILFKSRSVFVFVFLYLSIFGLSASAEGTCSGYSESFYKFPISIDGNYYLSSAGIRLNEKKLDLNISDDKKANADKLDSYLKFFEKIKNKDYKSILNLSEKSAFEGPEEAKKFVEMYWNAFDGLKDIVIMSDICLGDFNVVVWKTKTAKGWYVRSFKFTNKSHLFVKSIAGDKIEPILNKIFQFQVDGQNVEFKTSANTPKNSEFLIQIKDDVTVASIFFDWDKIMLDVLDKNVPPSSNQAVAFYAKFLRDFVQNKSVDISNNMTEGSQKKFKQWFEKTDTKGHEAFISQFIGSNRVVIISVDLGKVVMIFFVNGTLGLELKEKIANRKDFLNTLKNNPDDLKKYSIQHTWIMKDDSEFKLTNFFYVSLVDDFFNDFNLMLKPVLLHVSHPNP